MVQPGQRLWLRDPAWGTRVRRGYLRPYGNRPPSRHRRPAARADAGGAHRRQPQGPDRGRGPAARVMRHAMLAAAAALMGCTPQEAQLGLSPAGLQQIWLTLQPKSGQPTKIVAEVAKSQDEQARGLMYRQSLAPDRGMIFPYSPPQAVGFWMKNTLIPLDMVFI